MIKTGSMVRHCFNFLNASISSLPNQKDVFFFNRSLSLTILEYYGINFRKYPVRPKKLCICLAVLGSGKTAFVFSVKGNNFPSS